MTTNAFTDALPDALQWDERGLLPAVVQDARTGALLMLAWMNAEALERTRATGLAHFYSRSRQALWQKGETSGNTLAVRELRIDCDSDAILLVAEPAGPTCHTGARSCFYKRAGMNDGGAGEAMSEAIVEDHGTSGPPVAVLERLEDVLRARRAQADGRTSYTKSLLDGGFPKILAKIAEEHGELAEVLAEGETSKVVHETADLLFHVMIGLVARDIAVDQVWRELERRFGTGGHVEKAAREPRGR